MKIIISLILTITTLTNLYAIDANQIVQKADRFRGFKKWYSSTTKITYYKKDKKDSEQLIKVIIKDNSNSIVKFLKPSSMKGRILLMTGDNVWIHIPKTKNPIRLTPQQRLLGQVSNGDVARSNYRKDYNATLLGNKTIKGKKCYHLLLKAKRKNTTYQKIEYYVEKNSFKPVKAVFFAKSGKQLKEGYFKKLKIFMGRPIMSQLEIFDSIKKNEKTILESQGMRKEKIPGRYFNKNFLKRIR